ncbi:hypothetical protein BZM27_09375 [Paraburkholderia steynii]|uniref:Uncharacterized protein n=1 Tax=Paraburkholderia steynii TaxID=1245441 RepID=A0A4R0XQG3_9BURK|nr:hypothetical protein BZM27_09375 [Paraburkholderia steynii]
MATKAREGRQRRLNAAKRQIETGRSNFELLCDDLHRAAVAKGYADKKSGQATIKKSMTLHEVIAKAGLDPDRVTPFTGKPATIRERGVKVGDHVMVQGKKAVTDKSMPVDRFEPPEHVALRVGRAIADMKLHAQGANLNGPVTEDQLKACHALARAGEMSQEEVADVEKALNDKRALPTYILRKLSNA